MQKIHLGGICIGLALLLGAGCVPVENLQNISNNQEDANETPEENEQNNSNTPEEIVPTPVEQARTEPVVSIIVNDQKILVDSSNEMGVPANAIVVERVKNEVGIWLALYVSNNGEAGKFLGNAYLSAGSHERVPVYIAMPNITQAELDVVREMVVVVHRDAGIQRQFEYGGADTFFTTSNGSVIKDVFKVLE
ncbi:MAG: hypothetical protein WCW16_01360 [Candidatus Magasanikbacteria bacterium]